MHLMGISSPVLALDSIRKASKWEPYEKFKPRYLSLQGELEIGFGDKTKAHDTLSTAKQLMKKYKNFWLSEAQKDIVNRIYAALDELEKRET
jgi:hypothetical protein